MAGEDLEWLLRQFSSGGGSLPSLKSLGPNPQPSSLNPNQDASAGTASPQKSFQRYQTIEDCVQESFRDILSRSPYIFAANKRQEALLAQAAAHASPAIKFTSSQPYALAASKSEKASAFSSDMPVRAALNHSPKHAAAASRGVAAAAARSSGRASAPPHLEASAVLETSDARAAGKMADKRGKQAVIQRMERLRNDDEALEMLRQKVERYMERDREKHMSAGRLSPILKNRKGAKTQTLENRINKLVEQRLAREQSMQRVHDVLMQQRETFLEKMAEKSRHEQWLELKRSQQRERAIQKAKDALMQKWATTSAVVGPLLSMRSLFQLCRQKLPLLRRVKYCARVIMKTYRLYRNWKETKRLLAEKNLCSRICWRFLLNWRITKKCRALAAIKEMLNILKSMGVLQKAVRSFKYRVVVGQRCISSFLKTVHARLRVQKLQWATMHLAWAKAVAERQAKLNKTKVPAIISAVYQRLLGHYKSQHIRPPPNMVKRYNNFMKSSALLPLILDTSPEEVPCCTALLVSSQLRQLQKGIRQQFLQRRRVALAGNMIIKEQETRLRIRMQARSLLCRVPVEEKLKYEESVLQLQRTYAKPPPFPSTMAKAHVLQLMADYVLKADAAPAASVTLKMEVTGD